MPRRMTTPELHVLSHAWFKALPEADVALQRPVPNDIAYLQYTSGSTRFPRGVIITHREVMANLRAISHDGIKLRPGDRCVSWLPFYHDMGLVGFLLTPRRHAAFSRLFAHSGFCHASSAMA